METNVCSESYLLCQELRTIIREIVRLSDPEKILLLSASFEYLIIESIYFKNAVQGLRGKNFILLILFDAKDQKSIMTKELMLCNYFRDHGNLQFQITDIKSFNKDIKCGNEQATYILSNAMLWYDKEQVPLECPTGSFN